MNLSQLPKTTTKGKKRTGRGYGSGKGGHTAGRGQKGQKSRSKIPLTFTGTKIKKSLFKRLPLQRGKGKFNPLKPKPLVVNLKYLNLLKPKTEVTIESLSQAGIINLKNAQKLGVKILGSGDISLPLIIKLPISKSAAAKVEKAGGKIESVGNNAPTPSKEKPRTQKKEKPKKSTKPKASK
jgi:large subunit ribosomal protein L15